jgi:hypothetical protein
MSPCGCGKCRKCYFRRWYSRKFYGGFRDFVLERDGNMCVVCGSTEFLIVHHRKYIDDPDRMISLCASCHAVVHRLKSHRKWLDSVLLDLWIELHPHISVNLQLF